MTNGKVLCVLMTREFLLHQMVELQCAHLCKVEKGFNVNPLVCFMSTQARSAKLVPTFADRGNFLIR
jgi:hypothetical protein